MGKNGSNVALNDDELKTISGGIKTVESGKTDKYLDLLDTVLDCADQDNQIKKAGIKGLKSIVNTIKQTSK